MTTAAPTLPPADAPWTAWRDYGLAWARASADPTAGRTEAAGVPLPRHDRRMTMHAYREASPGPRWRALYDATWPAYRAWYLQEGEAARPTLQECRAALGEHMPELVPTWESLARLTADDPVAARLLSMWRLPAFAVGCSQLVMPGEDPSLLRNYDYDQALFEGVIASTDYSGSRRVLGTSDLLWGLLDGVNADGLAVSLTYGGRPGAGEGFGVPLVLRYVLETCADVATAVEVLRRIPLAQSYNIALADTTGAHATVFVAPGEPAAVSRLEATTNHRLDQVEHPDVAHRLGSLPRQERLTRLRRAGLGPDEVVRGLLSPPLRNDAFDRGFGTLYTVEYRPREGTATWHWPDASWTRGFADGEARLEVELPPN